MTTQVVATLADAYAIPDPKIVRWQAPGAVSVATGSSVEEPLFGRVDSIGYVLLDDFIAEDGDAGAALVRAVQHAYTLRQDSNSTGSLHARTRTAVVLRSGGVYVFKTTANLGAELARVDIRCLAGAAILKCSGDAGAKSFNGIVASSIYHTTFEGLIFQNFDIACEWDTNNVDAHIVTYRRCDFFECNVGVETRSFDESRSTVLVFDECRASRTARLVNSYCDMLVLRDSFMRNWSANSAFIKADSQVITQGGVYVPVAIGDGACWLELLSPDSSDRFNRGLNSYATRWSPEGGGIPVVYNKAQGETITAGRNGPHIRFFGGHASCGNAGGSKPGAVVVLASDGSGGSVAPQNIVFYGLAWSARSGLVATENGEPPTVPVGMMLIDIDQPAQARAGSQETTPVTVLIEPQLRKYMSPATRLFDNLQVITAGGTDVSLDVYEGRVIRLNPSSALSIVDFGTAWDGEIITLHAQNASATLKHLSGGGSGRIRTTTGADVVLSSGRMYQFVFHRAGTAWVMQ